MFFYRQKNDVINNDSASGIWIPKPNSDNNHEIVRFPCTSATKCVKSPSAMLPAHTVFIKTILKRRVKCNEILKLIILTNSFRGCRNIDKLENSRLKSILLV